MSVSTRSRSSGLDAPHSSSHKTNTTISGYKIFNNGFICKNYQYEVGKVSKLPERQKLQICKSGFHFCRTAVECLAFYEKSWTNTYAKVEALGNIIEEKTDIEARRSGKLITDQLLVKKQLWRDGFLKLCTGTIVRADDGAVLSYKEGEYHSENDKPAVVEPRFGASRWFSEGRRYRAIGPASVQKDNVLMEAVWYQKPSMFHRVGKPAVIKIYSNRVGLQFMQNNEDHNPDGPCTVFWARNGSEQWEINHIRYGINGYYRTKADIKEEDDASEFHTERFTKLLNDAQDSGNFWEAMKVHFTRWIDPKEDRADASQ